MTCSLVRQAYLDVPGLRHYLWRVLPADPAVREVGVQLVGRETFPVQQVAAWLDEVRSAIAGAW